VCVLGRERAVADDEDKQFGKLVVCVVDLIMQQRV
jgi:hypothetical protein